MDTTGVKCVNQGRPADKVSSMVAIKAEKIKRAKTYRRVAEEAKMLGDFIRLADYMLVEGVVARGKLREAKSSLGDAESSLGDPKSSLGDAKSSLGDAKSSLGDAESSLGDAESSLGDAESSLGDAKSSLGDLEARPIDNAKRCDA
jgi:chromosome segregation ATPase